MKRISPAMIVALVALFISLTANAGAVTYFVTSGQIKDGTIQLRDLSPSARAALHGRRGLRGYPGYDGLTGPQGPAGKSFSPYQIEGDLSKLCQGIRQLQQNVSPSGYLGWYPSFRYSSCSYYY
jgi:hypothetical protein